MQEATFGCAGGACAARHGNSGRPALFYLPMSAARTVTTAAAALLVALAVLAAAPGTDAAHRAACARAGSHTVAKNPYVRVFETGDRDRGALHGCLRSRDRRIRLADSFDDGYVESRGYASVRLARRYVAWAGWSEDISCKADCPPGYDSQDSWIAVRNLATGRRRSIETEALPAALVLTRTGAVAWARTAVGGQTELWADDADGTRMLDRGDIDPGSLARGGLSVSWTNAGERRSATLR